MDEVVLKNICGWIGASLLLFFYLSSFVLIIKVIRKQIPITDIPAWLYLFSLFNSLLWAGYSFYINELPSIVPNLFGIVILTILLTVYWLIYTKFVLMKYIIIIGAMYLGIAIIITALYLIFFQDFKDVIGYIASAISILMFASPGQKLIEVIKTGNYELIAIVSSVSGFFCSGFWLIFGIIINNISIMIANGCGFGFAILQLTIYVIFRLKAKGNKCRDRDKDKSTTDELIIHDNEAK